MIPIFQQIVDKGRGDCFNCCVASIFELNYDQVPNFIEDKSGTMDDVSAKWLNQFGYKTVSISLNDKFDIYGIDWILAKGLFCVLSVPSQKFEGGSHAVVGKFTGKENSYELKIVHDPNAQNVPYPDDVKISRVRFFVPVIPKVLISKICFKLPEGQILNEACYAK